MKQFLSKALDYIKYGFYSCVILVFAVFIGRVGYGLIATDFENPIIEIAGTILGGFLCIGGMAIVLLTILVVLLCFGFAGGFNDLAEDAFDPYND